MEEEKIDGDLSPTYTPQLNGTTERLNKTLQFRIRAMLLDSGLPPTMWVLAAEAAAHVCNRLPYKANDFQTPLEKFSKIWMQGPFTHPEP